jgi:hypothetical protein
MTKRRCAKCQRSKSGCAFRRAATVCRRCSGELHNNTTLRARAPAADAAPPAITVALHADRVLRVQALDTLVIVTSGRRLGRGRRAVVQARSSISLPLDRLRAFRAALDRL